MTVRLDAQDDYALAADGEDLLQATTRVVPAVFAAIRAVIPQILPPGDGRTAVAFIIEVESLDGDTLTAKNTLLAVDPGSGS